MSRILVIEYNSDMLQLLTNSLRGAGYQVLAVSSGEGLDIAMDAFAPHLIIMDAFLPGADALNLCRELRNRPATKTVPIIILSEQSIDSHRSVDAGADFYLEKPFTMREMLAVISKSIRPEGN